MLPLGTLTNCQVSAPYRPKDGIPSVQCVCFPVPVCSHSYCCLHSRPGAAGSSFLRDFLGIQAGLEQPAGSLLCSMRALSLQKKGHLRKPPGNCRFATKSLGPPPRPPLPCQETVEMVPSQDKACGNESCSSCLSLQTMISILFSHTGLWGRGGGRKRLFPCSFHRCGNRGTRQKSPAGKRQRKDF